MKGNKENVKKIIKMIDSRKDTFHWNDTPQGYKYWKKVFINFVIIRDKLNKIYCKECGAELKDE